MTVNFPDPQALREHVILLAGLSVILALITLYNIKHNSTEYGERFVPLFGMSYLFVFSLLMTPLMNFIFLRSDLQRNLTYIGSVMFRVFLISAVYYPLLLIAHRFLRKRYHPSLTAVLWQLPSVIYVPNLILNSNLKTSGIQFAISRNLFNAFFAVWLCGFVFCMGKKIIEHNALKRRIQNDCMEADEHMMEIYRKEIRYLRHQSEPPVYISSAVRTPLSIRGILFGTDNIILPVKDYSDDELQLIFRHELIHIQRQDIGAKFMMAVIQSFLWFVPGIRKTSRAASEDIELSCDQAVILDLDEEQKQNYADLILHTAGDEKGFTSCLSASGESLKYRLLNLYQIRNRYGTVLIAVCLFLILVISVLFTVTIV